MSTETIDAVGTTEDAETVAVPEAPDSVTRVAYKRGSQVHVLFVDSVTPEGPKHVLLRAEGLVKLIPSANILTQETYLRA